MMRCGRRRRMARSKAPTSKPLHSESRWSEDEIRKAVFEIFEACRKSPGTPYDTRFFLLFLTVEQTAAALDEGDGRARFLSFYKRIEERFQIWIGDHKMRKNWDADQFCAYLGRAIKNPQSGLRAAKFHNEQAKGCLIMWSLIMLLLIALSIWREAYWMAGATGAMYFAFGGFMALDYRRYRKIIRSRKP
jgi:hypothetical protein